VLYEFVSCISVTTILGFISRPY